jgi:hypothetical protein
MTSVSVAAEAGGGMPSGADQGPARALGMRQAMADFVHGAHQAYLSQARLLPPGEQAGMPLLTAGRVTVLAAAATNLHVLATTEVLPPVHGREVELADRIDSLEWTLRFYDPVVLPGLGLLDERDGARPEQVRRLLGIGTVLYHLVVQPGAQLTGHHAAHLGAGLAGSHATVFRGLATLRDRFGSRQLLVDELAGAIRAGLPAAAGLLAAALVPSDPDIVAAARSATAGSPGDPADLVGALLAATGPPA